MVARRRAGGHDPDEHTAELCGVRGPAANAGRRRSGLQRFWALVTAPKLSYHIETKGGGRIGDDAYTFSESLDVSDDSGAARNGPTAWVAAASSDIVTLDTDVWFKFPDGWHKNIEHDPYFRSRPFLDLDSQRDLVVSGDGGEGREDPLRPQVDDELPALSGPSDRVRSLGIQGRPLELDILVTADGVPVEATVHILAGGPGTDGKPQFDAKATRTFTKFGGTFTIKAPKS